jgi:hypothetical protein
LYDLDISSAFFKVLLSRSLGVAFGERKVEYNVVLLERKVAIERTSLCAGGRPTDNSGGPSLVAGNGGGVGGRAVVVKLAEAEALVDQLKRALFKKGQYMEQKLKVSRSVLERKFFLVR